MLQAQCPFDLGNDTVVCGGTSLTLTAPPGYISYQWSTTETTSSITVNVSGTYVCNTIELDPTLDMIVNGDFSAGNSGFTSGYAHEPGGSSGPLTPPESYGVSTDPDLVQSSFPTCVDHTTGTGNMLVVNGGPDPTIPFWCQTVPVTQNTDHVFSYWMMNFFGGDVAAVQVEINGVPILGPFSTPSNGCSWHITAAPWNSGTSTMANICLYDMTTADNSNDFAIDDITMVPLCHATDTIDVLFQPYPTVDLGPDLTVCSNEANTLHATHPGASYLWQDGSVADSLNYSNAGQYWVELDINGCTTADTIEISNWTLPIADLGPDTSICAGESITVGSVTPGATYLWSDGSIGDSLTFSSADTAWVQVTTNGCSVIDSVIVGITLLPVFDLGNDTIICPYEELALTSSYAGADHLWNTGVTTDTLYTSTAGQTWLTATVTGCSWSDTININHLSVPMVDLGNDTSICELSAVTLGSITSGATYLWSTGTTTDSLVVTDPGQVWLNVSAGGCTGSDTVNIGQIPLPMVDLGNDTSICADATLLLDVTTPGGTYLWSTGSIIATEIAHPDSSYWVEVTMNGCSSSDTINVDSNALPIVMLPADTALCPGEVLPLNATIPSGNYLWQDGSTNATINASSGTVHVEVTDANGCSASDTIMISAAPTANIDLGPGISICPGDSLMLDANFAGATYLWNDGSTAPAIWAEAGVHNVQVTLGHCTTYDTIIVTDHIVAPIDLGNDTTLCPAEQLLLQPTTTASLQWHNASTGTNFNVTQTGTYWVQATDVNNCITSDTILVNYASPNSVDLGNDTSICLGTSLVLDASSPGATLLWDNGSTAATRTVTAAGTYHVHVTTGNCGTADTINVGIWALPIVDLGNDTSICPGDMIPLNANLAGANYLWNNGATSATINAPAGGHSVTVTDMNGCAGSDAITISTRPITPIDLGPDVALCNGDSVTLNAGTTSTNYLWNTGASGQALTIGSAGNYWVSALQGPCPVGDTINVQVLPVPLVDLGPDLTLCDGETALLDASASGAASYTWQDGSTDNDLIVSSAGTYHVTTIAGSCSDQDTVQVQFLPLPVVDLGADTSLCAGESRMVDATTTNATYLWNDGSNNPDRMVMAGETAIVTVTVNGCSSQDTITMHEIPLPMFDLGNDTMLCRDETITLNGPVGMESYLWNTGAATPTLLVSTTAMGSLQVEQNGCYYTDSIQVGYVPLAAIDLGADTVICPYQEITLSTNAPNADLLWSTGSTSSSITVNTADEYWVHATLMHCAETDTALIGVEDIPFPDLGPDVSTCSNDPLTLSVMPGNAQVLWSTGSTADSILVQDSAQYWVSLQQGYCTTSDSIFIEIIPLMDQVSIGPDQTICHDAEARFSVFVPTANYSWSTGDIIPNITVNEGGIYTLHVTGYCIDAWDTAWVNVIDCGPYVHVPNAFTPNGDDVNETFGALVEEPLDEFELLIFDRWGQVIFNTRAQDHGWDGTVNGKVMPPGVYPWKMTFRRDSELGPSREIRMGHVTLLR